ncbi:MAG: amidohydrolase family protein [Chloroflexota bacterium]|nr:amidohydrolase family protein [Chloroflexota bacterium]
MPSVTGRIVESGDAVEVEVEGSRIGSLQPVSSAGLPWVGPGLIDIQVNGYMGHDLNDPAVTPDVVARLVRALWSVGVTGVCPTVITGSEARMCRSLEAVASACDSDPLVAHSVVCIHVEGPHISPEDGPRGAHPREHVRPPDLREYLRWQEASDGRVGIVTLAPEHPGSLEYIRALAADGVVVALGHTAASGEQLRAAVDAGARLSTHLGNGSQALIPRHSNYIWEQLAEDRLLASFIFDGHHLPPAAMKVMLRAKGPERAVLVSDAVAVAGQAPGVYETAVGGTVELLPSGRLVLRGTPYLAGSASTLLDGIANAVRYAGVSLPEAVRLASIKPARLLRLDGPDGRGSVRSGAVADLVLFDHDPVASTISVLKTIVRGEVVYSREA